MPAMARPWFLVLLPLLPGCGDKPAAASSTDGSLVLEVGGAAPSLAQDLRSLGYEPRPPLPPTPLPVAPPSPMPE